MIVFSTFNVALKVMALSEIIITGNPHHSVNLLRLLIKVDVVKSMTRSRWKARVVQHINKQIQALLELLFSDLTKRALQSLQLCRLMEVIPGLKSMVEVMEREQCMAFFHPSDTHCNWTRFV